MTDDLLNHGDLFVLIENGKSRVVSTDHVALPIHPERGDSNWKPHSYQKPFIESIKDENITRMAIIK